MAIQKELFGENADGVKLYRTFSDENRKILQNETGLIYDDAVDVENTGFTYSEVFNEQS
jgi:hypothetical protein